jgi:hypothetical protein
MNAAQEGPPGSTSTARGLGRAALAGPGKRDVWMAITSRPAGVTAYVESLAYVDASPPESRTGSHFSAGGVRLRVFARMQPAR